MKAFCLSFASLLLAGACCANPLSADVVDSGYIDILDSVASDPTFSGLGETISIAFFFDMNFVNFSDTTWSPGHVAVELRGEGAGHVPFSVGVSGTLDSLMIGVSDDYISGAEKVAGTSSSISTHTRYHAVFTVSGDDYAIYLDGELDASGTFSTATGDRSTGSQTANLQIGFRSRDGGQKDANPWRGSIEDLIIWDTDLSAGQARMLYTTRHATVPHPVLWRGGNPIGTATGHALDGVTIPDRSPNNNNGIGVNGSAAFKTLGSHVKKRKVKMP